MVNYFIPSPQGMEKLQKERKEGEEGKKRNTPFRKTARQQLESLDKKEGVPAFVWLQTSSSWTEDIMQTVMRAFFDVHQRREGGK